MNAVLPQLFPLRLVTSPRGFSTAARFSWRTRRAQVSSSVPACPMARRNSGDKPSVLRGHQTIAFHQLEPRCLRPHNGSSVFRAPSASSGRDSGRAQIVTVNSFSTASRRVRTRESSSTTSSMLEPNSTSASR